MLMRYGGGRMVGQERGPHQEGRGMVVDYPGNPRSCPRIVEKIAWTTKEMQQRRDMLTHHALLVTEEGPLGVASKEEVVEIIRHHFGLRRYECHVYRCKPEHFIVIFNEDSTRD